jgi:hypothetical protein
MSNEWGPLRSGEKYAIFSKPDFMGGADRATQIWDIAGGYWTSLATATFANAIDTVSTVNSIKYVSRPAKWSPLDKATMWLFDDAVSSFANMAAHVVETFTINEIPTSVSLLFVITISAAVAPDPDIRSIYRPAGHYNGVPYWVGDEVYGRTIGYIWYSTADEAWILSTALGVKGATYWHAANPFRYAWSGGGGSIYGVIDYGVPALGTMITPANVLAQVAANPTIAKLESMIEEAT